PRLSCADCATSAPPTNGSSRSTAPATTTTTNQSSPPACPSAPASKPSTPPAASTSTTQPPGPDPRRTYGQDHLVATWTGWHANALRQALRMTNEEFAEHLSVAVRTVVYWRTRP